MITDGKPNKKLLMIIAAAVVFALCGLIYFASGRLRDGEASGGTIVGPSDELPSESPGAPASSAESTASAEVWAPDAETPGEDGDTYAEPEPEPPAATEPPEPEKTEEPRTIMVHIIGAVVNPGVYEVPERSRVIDAVNAAGGLTDDADAESVNLSRYISDTQQIRIYRIGERPPDATPEPEPEPTPTPAPPQPEKTETPKATEKTPEPPKPTPTPEPRDPRVNINTADKAELTTLPGIGDVIAGYIISYRNEHGGFKSVEELMNVTRIGEKTFEGLKDLVRVE